MAKRAKRKAGAPLVTCEIDPPMFVYFSGEVLAERETFRRLAHRVVDLLVDNGQDKWLHQYVAENLAYIARDHVVKKVTDLVREVWTEGKKPNPDV